MPAPYYILLLLLLWGFFTLKLRVNFRLCLPGHCYCQHRNKQKRRNIGGGKAVRVARNRHELMRCTYFVTNIHHNNKYTIASYYWQSHWRYRLLFSPPVFASSLLRKQLLFSAATLFLNCLHTSESAFSQTSMEDVDSVSRSISTSLQE